jgi:electron transport complex protein RnfB
MGEIDIYRKLQQCIDRMPVGMPEVPSGADIRILKHLFTPEEAKIAVHLSALPEPSKRIHKRVLKAGIQITHDQLIEILDRLYNKGAIMGGPLLTMLVFDKKQKYYSLAPLAVGMFELQANNIKLEMAEAMHQIFNDGFVDEYLRNPPYQIRTIPIEKSITPERCVGSYDDIRKLISETKGPIVLNSCVCRDGKDLVGEKCKLTDVRACCIALESIADYSIDRSNNAGTSANVLTKDETLKLIDQFEDIGMVLQPENVQHPKFICCCCGCCCGVLSNLRKLDRPSDWIVSNYYAEVNRDLCTGCKLCEKRCQMGAVHVVDKIAIVDLTRCIGCGLCVPKCKAKAISIKVKSKTVKPTKTHDGMYVKIMMHKRGPLGSLKMVGNIIAGKKV